MPLSITRTMAIVATLAAGLIFSSLGHAQQLHTGAWEGRTQWADKVIVAIRSVAADSTVDAMITIHRWDRVHFMTRTVSGRQKSRKGADGYQAITTRRGNDYKTMHSCGQDGGDLCYTFCYNGLDEKPGRTLKQGCAQVRLTPVGGQIAQR